MRLASGWKLSTIVAVSLLGACATERSEAPVIIAPLLYDYSPTFQAAAADELDQLGAPCPRDVLLADCSPVARLVQDYRVTRDMIRHAEEEAEPGQ